MVTLPNKLRCLHNQIFMIFSILLISGSMFIFSMSFFTLISMPRVIKDSVVQVISFLVCIVYCQSISSYQFEEPLHFWS